MPIPLEIVYAIDEGYNAAALKEAPLLSTDMKELIRRSMWMRGFRFRISGLRLEDALNPEYTEPNIPFEVMKVYTRLKDFNVSR